MDVETVVYGAYFAFAGVFVLLGCIIWLSGFSEIANQWRLVRRCDRVHGRLVDTEVDQVGSGKSARYYPLVEYEFESDGEQWVGARLGPEALSTGYESEAEAWEYVEGLVVGDDSLTVYVPPGDPSRAFLDQTYVSVSTLFTFGIGLMFALIGVGMIVVFVGVL